jgi:predicted phage terminase large subunit-like protein
MAAKLQKVRDGRIRRLIINIPPRHLESLAASIALPAWLLDHDPAKATINVTYGQELSDKFACDCRAIMMASWYRDLFPTRLTSPRAPLQELVTTQGGFRLATSVGGVLTGRGADLIVIDDPLKPSDAMSESRRVAANEWFDGTLYSRLNDKTRGAIVIEDKASGTQLIQDLVDAGLSRVTSYKPDGDKIMRLHAQTATIENGFVHLPETAHWLADYLHELTLFPAGRYDDQVDSTAQALAWTKIRSPGWAIFEHYRELAEERNRTAPERFVSLKTPPSVIHVYGLWPAVHGP